jgi:murein DD-endopeptidase MepM/ murein hydrolase activator NlpD
VDGKAPGVSRRVPRGLAAGLVLAVLAGFVMLSGLFEAPAGVAAPAVVEAPDPVPTPPADVAPGAAYAWPLAPPPAVLSPFRGPPHPFGPGHRGVDLAGTPDQPVRAAREGTVVFAGQVAGRGAVSVQHPDGLRTTYEPVRPSVSAGARVARGETIGLLQPGHPGCVAVCLHWGARRDRLDYLDPLALLRPPRVRLLPVPDPWPG